jgi:hypothetical protein
MSPLYAIHNLREQTKAELAQVSSPFVRNVLELQLRALTRKENALRVQVLVSREHPIHTPAPVRCSLALTSAPTLASASHWSFDEIEAQRQKAINRTHSRLESLFGPAPRALALAVHNLGGIKKCLNDLSLDVFLTLPPDIRRAKGALILTTIHQKITK